MNCRRFPTNRRPGSRIGRFAVLGGLLLCGIHCSPGSTPKTQAVVMIVIDTLRADRLAHAGCSEARTPNLDALARRGTRFDQAWTPAPVTLPAISSLLTGRYPFGHGVRDNDGYVLDKTQVTLAEHLQRAGWSTAAVVASAIVAADRGLDQGFEIYDDHFGGDYPVYNPALAAFAPEFAETRRRADTVTNRAIELIRRFEDAPFFLFVHYFDVHSYYDPPPAHAKNHPGRPYDGEVSFVDAEVGRLLESLRHRPDALVMVVSDHGEGLGEHGEPEHGFLLYQSTLAIPWIAAGPGVPESTVRAEPVSLVDVTPTLLAHLGLGRSGVPMDGRALSWSKPASPAALYAETMRPLVSYHWSELRALYQEPYKLIHGPRNELYRLDDDPTEIQELGPVEPTPKLLETLVEKTGGETRTDILSALRGEADPARRELLESLGYIGGSDGGDGEERPYPHPKDELPRWLQIQKGKVLYRRAVALAAQGQPSMAISLFDSVLAAEPDRADAFYNRGLAKRAAGDAAGFNDDIAAALRHNPDYVPALAVQAELEAGSGRTSGARALWLRILELDSGNAGALRALSREHLERDDPESALPYLRRLINERPRDVSARYNLGLAALRAERPAEAREHLEVFLQLSPNDPRAQSVRRTLAGLGG